MATTSYSDLPPVTTVNDDDVFAVDQPSVQNPVTQNPGVSRKVRMDQVSEHVKTKKIDPAVLVEKNRAESAEDALNQGQTAAAIKTKYESNPNTNAYTNPEKTTVGRLNEGFVQDVEFQVFGDSVVLKQSFTNPSTGVDQETNKTIPLASATNSGLASKEDKSNLDALVTDVPTRLKAQQLYSDGSWEMRENEADGGGHWYWDFTTGTLRFDGFNNDPDSPIVWEAYEINGGGPNFVTSGGTRIGRRSIYAWDGGAVGVGTLRFYITTGKNSSAFGPGDEITTHDWVSAKLAGEVGIPLGNVATRADLLALTGMKENDWIYVIDDTDGTTHVGETWSYAYDGAQWVELGRVNEQIIPEDDVTLEIAGGVRKVKDGGISSQQLAADAVTDAKIGDRTLADNAAADTLISIAAKGITAWFQGIRDNLKYLFSRVVDATNSVCGVIQGSATGFGTVGIDSNGVPVVNGLDDTGDGSMALLNDGSYGLSGKVDTLDGIESDANKNIRLQYYYPDRSWVELGGDNYDTPWAGGVYEGETYPASPKFTDLPRNARIALIDEFSNTKPGPRFPVEFIDEKQVGWKEINAGVFKRKYRKEFRGNIVAAANTPTDIVLRTGVEWADATGAIKEGGSSWSMFPSSNNSTNSYFYLTIDGAFRLWSKVTGDRSGTTNNDYVAIIEYTRTDDPTYTLDQINGGI